MKKLIAVVLAGGLVFGALGSANAKAPSLWTDESGDADNGQGLGASIPGGFDLVGGGILQKGKNLEFVVTHADMPPSGSLPEGFRFLWSFGVGKGEFRVTAKSADIGKPDVLQGQTNERVGRVDLMGHFRLEGDCGSETVGALNAVNCKPLAYLDGSFDPATKSFTVVVPLKSIKAKKGSVVRPGAGESTTICAAQICWVSHTAERSLNATLIDTAVVSKSFKVR